MATTMQSGYIWWLELENLDHTGGLRSWNSALGCRLRVQAPGRGSFSPVATFKLCSYRSLLQVTPACITLTDNNAVMHHLVLHGTMVAVFDQQIQASDEFVCPSPSCCKQQLTFLCILKNLANLAKLLQSSSQMSDNVRVSAADSPMQCRRV